MHKLVKGIKLYYNDNKWFWKLGKKGYKNILIQLIKEDQAIQIQKYGEEKISIFPIG